MAILPITPETAFATYSDTLPEFVVAAWNECITKNLRIERSGIGVNVHAKFLYRDLLTCLQRKSGSQDEDFEQTLRLRGYLDLEWLFLKYGWTSVTFEQSFYVFEGHLSE